MDRGLAHKLESIGSRARFGRTQPSAFATRLSTDYDDSVPEKDFHITLPTEVLGGFGWNDVEVPSRIREALVMDLLRRDRLSEAEAASMLKITRIELLKMMAGYDVPAVRMSDEELDRELATEVKRNGTK